MNASFSPSRVPKRSPVTRRSRSSAPSSPATRRRPRWMSTRTAPSDRPRIAAISAVVISWTKRSTTARRRSPRRPSTARNAAAAASRRDDRPLDVDRVRRRAGEIEGRLRSAASPAAALGHDVAGDPEQPDPERRCLGAVLGARALLEAGQPGERGRGTSARWRPRPRDGRRARRPRSCTPGPGTSDTGRRTAPGRSSPLPPGADRGPGGRGADDRPPPVVPPSSMPVGPSRYTPPAVAADATSGRRAVPDLADEHLPLAGR